MDGSARKRKRTLARKAARQRERDLRAASKNPWVAKAKALVAYYDREIEIAKEIEVVKGVFAVMYGPAQAIVGRDLAVKMLVRQGAEWQEAEDFIDGLPGDEEEAE